MGESAAMQRRRRTMAHRAGWREQKGQRHAMMYSRQRRSVMRAEGVGGVREERGATREERGAAASWVMMIGVMG